MSAASPLPWVDGNPDGERALLVGVNVAYTVRGGGGTALPATGRAVVITRWLCSYRPGDTYNDGPRDNWTRGAYVMIPIEAVWCLWEIGAREGWFNGI